MLVFLISLLFVLIAFVIICLVKAYRNHQNKVFWKVNTNKNFPFKWHGKTLWYSRSVAVSIFTFCKNTLGEWCVLANQRGNGTPDYQGYWNCCCGYLDWNEDSIQAALRETKEETGVRIPKEKVKIVKVVSDPSENRQNVSIRHMAVLDSVTSYWSDFSKKYMEKDEVSNIMWIPVSKIGEYKWAFNHDKIITELFYREINKVDEV
jgi:ADP-ribose pyrophosphatase YjhB (NUDIX family)